MKKRLFFVVMMMSAFFMMEVQAQNFSLKGEFRPRMEYRHGYKNLFPEGKQPALFISQRSRLMFNYKSEDVKVGFSLQNVGVWGETKTLRKSDVNGINVHEAWGQFKLAKGVELKVGRQEIIYDDHRIFGSVNWAQQGRSHDAAIFKLSPRGGKCKIDLGFAYNANGESLTGSPYSLQYKAMQFMHYHRNFGELGLSFLFLNNGMPSIVVDEKINDTTLTYKEVIAYSQTFGPRFTYKTDNGLKANAAFYYQMGALSKYTDMTDLSTKSVETKALYAAADVSYSKKGFTGGLGFEYLSGTDMDADPTKPGSTFKPLYGTNHKFNGWMDYFYVGFGNSTGLMDIYVPVKYKYNKLTLGATYHNFSATAKVIDSNNETMNSSLGSEIDAFVAYPFSKSVIFKAGYSQMMATKTMEVVKGGSKDNGNNWAWMMLVIKPTFFSK